MEACASGKHYDEAVLTCLRAAGDKAEKYLEITLTDVMDKIVVDDWGQCKEGGKLGSLSPHVRAGKLTAETVHAELGEIVAGKKVGRESDDERILFWHRGLSINDIALGQLYYEKALEMGIGTKLLYR